jgi:hypothetical protein
MGIRQSIIDLHQKGTSISSLARTFEVSRGTVHTLVKRYQSQGQAGLKPRYANCGKSRPTAEDFVYRAVRCFKTWHPSWGGEKIHAELLRLHPDLPLPCPRTFYRWFQWNGQTTPKTRLPNPEGQWAKQVHEGWQIDAKEEIPIADGSRKSWLNITDERSGTIIDPPAFPPQKDW